jgi:transglutaminase-like putative cysteine protease
MHLDEMTTDAMTTKETKEMTTTDTDYLYSTSFIDSGNPSVIEFAQNVLGDVETAKEKALALYGAVRDQIQYDPYIDFFNPAVFRASDVLRAGRGFCVGKSALLAAAARAAGIPARPGYADVRNHLTSKRLKEQVGDTFIWHSYTELKIDGKWVKCTPAFDICLCERARIKPLDFDGVNDSLFHPLDQAGRQHMEYLQDRGTYADVPFDTILADFKTFYPKLVAASPTAASFRDEVTA